MSEMSSDTSRKRLKYDRNDIQVALKEIEEGRLKIREASRKYNIPRGTLQDRIHGRSKSIDVRLGRLSILSKEEEECLELWVTKLAKCGFPLKRHDIQNTVLNIVKEDQRPTPFVDQRPGRRWYESFMQRHPSLKERVPEGITRARAVVSEEYIRKWFRELKAYLTSMNALDVLEDARRILNGDETSFQMCPKSGKVIAPKGWKNCYEIKSGSEKETITVLLVFSAAGETVVPMVVFPYVRPPKEVISSMPPNWFLGRSETGWMKSEIFFEYVANGVNKWLIEKEVPRPVLLLVDGHKSHLTMHLSEFCNTNDIILYALPPNTTHILQPADVSVFRPLKNEWRKTVRDWQNKAENFNRPLTKTTFCPLLEEVLKIDMSETIRNGFRKCGLFPFNPDAVDYSKCVLNTIENFINEDAVTKQEKETTVKVLKHFEKALVDNNINIDHIIEIINGTIPSEGETNLNTTEITIGHTTIDAETTRNPLVDSSKPNNDPKNDIIIMNRDMNYIALDSVDVIHNVEVTLTTASENEGVVSEAVISYNKTEDSEDKYLAPAKSNRNVLSELNIDNIQGQPKEIQAIANIIENSQQIETNKFEFPMSDSLINNLDIASDFSFSLLNSPYQSCESRASTPSNRSFQTRSKSNTPTNRGGISPCFRKHLYTPKSLSFSNKRKSKENLPSAISSEAWRNFMKEKESAKTEQNKQKEERKNKLQLLREKKAKKKEELIKKRAAAAMQRIKRNTKLTKPPPTATQSRIQCVGCEEDLISDVEEDDLKNIGCDKCPRWFHLKCTVHRGKQYSEVANEEFICHVCYV